MVQAQWTANKYKVYYNANRGNRYTTNTTSQKSQTCTYDKTYHYLGNSTFNAYWTVKFDPNGGTVSTKSRNLYSTLSNWGTNRACGAAFKNLTSTDNGTVNLNAQWTNTAIGELPTPTRTGYTFKGWYTSPTGGTKISTTTVPTGHTTYYAQWTENKYDIAFDLNKGTGSTDPILDGSKTPSNVTLKYTEHKKINNPTRAGYTFKGWEITNYTAATACFTDGKNIGHISPTPADGAQWTPGHALAGFNEFYSLGCDLAEFVKLQKKNFSKDVQVEYARNFFNEFG